MNRERKQLSTKTELFPFEQRFREKMHQTKVPGFIPTSLVQINRGIA